MKKILSIIFAIMLIFSCFAFTAFAEDMWIEDDYSYADVYYDEQPIMTFSEDFKKLYVNDEPFSRFDTSMITTDFGYTVTVDDEYNPTFRNSAYVDLTDAQKENVEDILIETNQAKNMYRIKIFFDDGSNLTIYFLQDTYFEDYNEIIKGNAEHYLIDFMWPDGNIVTTKKSALFGEAVAFNKRDFSDLYEFYYVTASNKDGIISMYVGVVFKWNDSFYYADYEEADIEDGDFFFEDDSVGVLEKCTVHKITDETLLADLQEAEQRYYDDDYGIFYDDDTTDAVSAVFLIFVFAVIPAVIFVIFLIKAIRGKGVYKKIYGAVAAFCIAELAVFTIIAVIIASTPSVPDFTIGESYGEEYIVMDTDYSNEEAVILKKGFYCGDGGCTDGCTTGYFYCEDMYYIDNIMSELGLGEPNGYDEYYSEKTMETSIIVDATEHENGYIVEYEVIGVG